MRRARAKLIGAAVLVALCAGTTPALADVPPGFDLFETDPSTTVFSFRDEFTIPPNFFDEGSAAFQGDVQFGGLPLGTFQGRDVGNADTVVRRPEGATLAQPYPSQDVIPLEVLALSLVGMRPIEVQVGTETQQWDVFGGLSPTRPSQGVMRILQTAPEGGAFDSQIQVFPQFSFRRLSDGETRTLDVGQLPLSQQGFRDLVLESGNVPWRAGCVPPALAIPGLNDAFCPGQTAAGGLQLRVERSRVAGHGVYPAQPQLEHFRCHVSATLGRFGRRAVTLIDQFGEGRSRVLRPVSLCMPVRKNAERFENRDARLHCYPLRRSTFTPRDVAVRNQFGSAVLRVRSLTGMCVPAVTTRPSRRRPTELAPDERIDNFRCYSTDAPRGLGRPLARVRGQFGRQIVRVLRPVVLCAPASTKGESIQHPVQHLLCHRIRPRGGRPFRQRSVRVHDRFGSRVAAVVSPETLCVPTLKLPL